MLARLVKLRASSGFKLDGGAVVVERRAVLFQAPVSVGSIVVSLSVLWIEPQRLAVVIDRLLILAEIEISIAAVEISFRKLGMGFDDIVIFDQRFFDLTRLVSAPTLALSGSST